MKLKALSSCERKRRAWPSNKFAPFILCLDMKYGLWTPSSPFSSSFPSSLKLYFLSVTHTHTQVHHSIIVSADSLSLSLYYRLHYHAKSLSSMLHIWVHPSNRAGILWAQHWIYTANSPLLKSYILRNGAHTHYVMFYTSFHSSVVVTLTAFS